LHVHGNRNGRLPRFHFDASLRVGMPKPKYALDALEQLRDAKVDEAKKVLADAVRAREAATARRQAAELALETRTHEIAHIRERERVKLEMGGADAHDLALASAWEIGARAELEQLAGAVTQRKSEETAAQQKEAEARAAVAMKRADA